MLARREQNRLVAGVAGGIADRLGVLDLYVRAAFLVLALIWGLGILLYLVLWGLTIDQTARPEPDPPADSNRRAAYILMFIGSLLLLRSLGIWSGDGWVWPGAALSFGIAFLMDRGDIDPRSAILGLFDPHSGRFRARTVIGVVLLLIGVSILANVAAPAVGTVLLAVLLTGVGMAVLFGQSSGPTDPINLAVLAGGSNFITRPTLMTYTKKREDLEASAAALFDVVGNGQVRIEINQRYALAEAQQAHRDLEGRKTTGSTLLIP